MNSARTIVFFDGGCRLCAAEIRHYANLDGGRRLELVDFTQDQTLLNALGVSYEQAMRRLHVLDQDGIMVDGARAFLAIWSELPYYRVVAGLVYLTRAIPWFETCYHHFAVRRYASRCKTNACSLTIQAGSVPERAVE